MDDLLIVESPDPSGWCSGEGTSRLCKNCRRFRRKIKIELI